ncbi:MAG: HAD-IB family hydrolase [Saprospiraceae bacterium]|nr:HAD-IB family hydrolase [Saprospiraceae bacterium]
MKHQPALHLCDFDGTLTRGDSLLRFLWFAVPKDRLIAGILVLPFQFLLLFFTGKWSNEAGKKAVLAFFFQGNTREGMEQSGDAFCAWVLPAQLRTDLLAKLRGAQQEGDKVVVVSASVDIWLRPFCEAEGFDYLCTELDFKDGIFSGQLATPNCNGAEKARRIREAYDLTKFARIVAYGNSSGDEAMFALAGEVLRF